MSDIRGLIIQSRLDYVENHRDTQIYQQLLHKLDEPVRNAIGEQVFITNLYSFHVLKDLDSALGEVTQMPLENLFREIGERSAPLLLDRYFYNYIQNQDPHGFLAQIGRLYDQLCHFGRYSYVKTGKQEADITFDYDEDIHKSYCWFIQTLLKKGVEVCGGKSVSLKEKLCLAEDGEACRYHLTWKS
ncbi:MAG: TIGR02265 family protein [bacterium]|nr:MAG: TIGR02265 family protein [bacterium]